MNFTYGLIFDWVYDVLTQKCSLSSSYVLNEVLCWCWGYSVNKSEMCLFLKNSDVSQEDR